MKAAAIRTARIPAALSRRQAVRSVLEQWLQGADPARHGLPASALVLVRRVHAPWLQVAAADGQERYDALGEALAGAARPARGGHSEQAVWFADEPEVLACLARDAVAGGLAQRWWWRMLLAERSPEAARARWLQSPRQLPQAVLRLGPVTARRWLGSWPAAERTALVAVLAQAYPVSNAVQQWVLEGRLPAQQSAGTAPPNARGLPAAGTEVPAVERLYRIACALAVNPMAAMQLPVSEPGLPARAVAPGQRPIDAAQLALSPPGQDEACVPLPPAAAGLPLAAVAALPVQQEGVPSRRTHQATAMPRDSRAHPQPPQARALRSLPLTAADIDVPAGAPDTGEAGVGLLPPAAGAVASTDHETFTADDRASTPQALRTSFGGTLFLLNAALQVGLYGDFTQPRHAGLPCSPWRFLLAASSALAGRRFASDPLAAWLRGRDRAAGGARRPWTRACTEALAAECRRLGLAAEAGAAGPWPLLRTRLAAALDLPSPRQIAAALLRVPARVLDAGERVDLFVSLADLPLAVRLAGLDRDPGWVPAAGCELRFHFE